MTLTLRSVLSLLLAAAPIGKAAAFFVPNKNAASIAHHNQQVGSTGFQRHSSPSRSSRSCLQMMEVVECDVAIVGGGPAGCTCALYTSRADLSTVILDKNPSIGALAITSHIANYPGVDRSMSGAELLEQMRNQAIEYGTRYERAQVFMIDIEDSDVPHNKVVYTPDLMIRARGLVLATGAMGRAQPPYPGEAEYLGQGVSYCATCDGAFYRDSEVAVFGATNEAMEEALFLTKFASTVHWITSQDVKACLTKQLDQQAKGIECNKIIEEGILEMLLEKDNVKHWDRTKLLGVEGDVSGVTGVKVKRRDGDGNDEIIPVEGAFIYGAGGGSKPITDFIQNKVELDDNGGVMVDADMETSEKGVFAIGDIRNTPYKQVVVAASDGCIAAMSIERFLKNRKSVKVDWIHK